MFFMVIGLTIFTKLAASQRPSPCPEVLSYETRTLEDDKWYGVLTLQSEEDLTGIYINILLDRPTQLLGNWFGEISTTDNREFLIQDRKYKVKARNPITVRFFVKFSRAQTIPSVSVVRFNGKTVCSNAVQNSIQDDIDRVENSGIVMRPTSTPRPFTPETRRTPPPKLNLDPVSLESTSTSTDFATRQSTIRPQPIRETTTRFGSQVDFNQETNKLLNSDEDSDFFHGDFAQTASSAQNRPESSFTTQIPEANQACGVVTTSPRPLISKGHDTRPGQWPWHASLYHSKGLQLQYICGGTLITDQHVVTAAHCVTKPSTETVVDKGNLLIYLGKHTLVSFGTEVQDRDVAKIFVHPEYNATSYFNDIAVIKLARPVQITNYVRTCCLWDEDPELESVENRVGTVVGWGFDENKKLSNKLMEAQMPVVPTIKCIYSNRDFFLRYTFEKNFCAGFRNGTSVCNGDSGGGLVFQKRGSNSQKTVWQLRGLVSIGVALQGQGACDTSQFIVFTDVAKFTHWIRQVIAF